MRSSTNKPQKTKNDEKREKTPNRKPRLSQTTRRRVAARTEAAPPNAKQQVSNEERLSLIVRRAVYLHGIECQPYRVIAQQLRDEFNLAFTPAISTICNWMAKGNAEFYDDIKELQKQIRLQQFEECEELKGKWFDAAHRKIEVTRTRIQDGSPVEIVDENAFAEQARAAEIYLKLLARQAKLLGLDMETSTEGKNDKIDIQQIYLSISRLITYGPRPEKQEDGKVVALPILRFGELEMCLDSGAENEL